MPQKEMVATEQVPPHAFTFHMGARFCPNPTCGAPVFVVASGNEPIFVFPRSRLPFDTSKLPEEVLGCVNEAISCHSEGCYRAAALMVRRALEELCADQGAKGADLKARIAALGGQITMPKELLEAADELRLLGNDAAHVEAKRYSEVGAEEVELAITLTQELVKAVYQHEDLLGRLRALNKPQDGKGAAPES